MEDGKGSLSLSPSSIYHPPSSHLPLPLIPRRRLPILRQMTGAPKQAPRHQIQVAWIGHGLVVMPDRRGEDLRLAVVFIRPRDDVVLSFLFAILPFNHLRAADQRFGGGEQLPIVVIVVKLLFDRRPVFHVIRDR